MSQVELEKRGNVAIVWLHNPPVNALGLELRRGIANALAQAAADNQLVGTVIASRHAAFSGGADIKEFGLAPVSPSLRDLIETLDTAAKPTVAAINGVALGGGLELALACDGRIVTSSARLGLPETNLGLLPGAGGTQRMPRLIAPFEALAIMADARPRMGEDAVRLGLADALVAEEALIDAAVARAQELAKGPRKRIRDLEVAQGERDAFEAASARLVKVRAGEPQIEALVDSVRATFSTGFDEGLRLERAHFERLLVDDRSRALRHVFFAERSASHLPKDAAAGTARPVVRVGVIGGGTMGTGIAMAFASSGIAVALKETDAEAAGRAVNRIAGTYARSVEKGTLSASVRDEIMSRIAATADYHSFADVDLVVEAAFEDIDVKRGIFRDLVGVTKSGAILATNTSYLDIDSIAEVCDDPGLLVGMHFFSPANLMKLVEVVRGSQTSVETLATIVAVAKKLGKLPVVVGNCHGFVGNRMLARRSEQVDRLLLEGAAPEQVDAALTDFGFKMGPCAMGDLAGLDISWRMRRATGRVAPAADALVEAGRLGQKSGSGYYRYGEDGRTPISDPRVGELIEAVASKHGTRRREIDPGEIFDRLVLAMVNEGARILEEGIAARASDIDVIWIHGYGFPRHRGGPMFYAQTRGFVDVVSRLEALAAATGDESLRPTPYLRKLANNETIVA